MSYIKQVSDLKQLKKAWLHVKRKKDVAPGIDNISVDKFCEQVNNHLKIISSELKNGLYKFQGLVEVKIPKKSNPNKFRNIGIFTIRDKIVQRSLQILLEGKKNKRIFNDIYNKTSIGFINGKFKGDSGGVLLAVKRIKKYYKDGFRFVVTADIKDFFDIININSLKNKIFKKLGKDKSINYLIEQCLKPDVFKKDRYFYVDSTPTTKNSGVAQGSILSPLFSNIYLANFDIGLEKLNIPAIRYADDLIIFSKNKNKSKKNLIDVKNLLKKTAKELEFHPDNTTKGPKLNKMISGFEFLGIFFKKIFKSSRWEIRPTDKKIKLQLEKINSELDIRTNKTLFYRILFLDRSITSWLTTYTYCLCTQKQLSLIYKKLKDQYILGINNLLINKKIIKQPLDEKQQDFIGIMTYQKEFLKRKKK